MSTIDNCGGPVYKPLPDPFAINQNRLDTEWLAQPRLYYQEAAKAADLRAEFERAKARRDVVVAELDQDVRSNAANYGIEKITESTVEHAIVRSKKHRQATEAVIVAKHAMDVQDAMVQALEHRKKALEKAVELFLANYFAKPSLPDEAGQSMKRMETREAFKGARKK